MKKNDITNDYIQFSKRVTRIGMILVSIAFALCICAISFFNLAPEAFPIITSLYTAYVTIMGITIGAYQGNSSLEKWSKAKYQYEEELIKSSQNEEE